MKRSDIGHGLAKPPCSGTIPFGSGRFLKDANREAIMRYVRQTPGLSRTDLSEQAGLAKATVSDLVNSLIADGWLTESEFVGRRIAGRLPRPLALDRTRRRLLGCQISDEKSVVVAMTLTGEVTELNQCNVTGNTPMEILEVLSTQISDVCQKLEHRDVIVSGIGLAVPGPVHPVTGVLLFSDHAGWSHLPIRDMFSACLERLDLAGIPMHVGRAVNCVAQHHFESEAVLEDEPVLYVHVGQGIAASIIARGQPVVGLNGSAGAIAHLEMEPEGAICDCGKRGCANATVTLTAIGRRLGLPDRVLRERYAEKDARVVAVVDEIAQKLAGIIHDLCLAYDPARIFASGHAFKLGTQFQTAVRNRLEFLAGEAGRKFPRLKVVRLDAHDGARGAAMLMLRSSLGRSIYAEQDALPESPRAVPDRISFGSLFHPDVAS